jgi:hypothetical protein
VIYARLCRKFVPAPWLPVLVDEVLPERKAGAGIDGKDEGIQNWKARYKGKSRLAA